MLLKIYCENIVITFLNCIFPLFLSTRPYISFFLFFFFFSLDFSPPHTYTLISTLSFFFSQLSSFHFILEPASLFLSPALFLYIFFSTWFQMEKEVERERTDGLDGSAMPSLCSLCRRAFCSTAIARLPPNAAQIVDSLCLFFLFFFF